jgi:NitT/TauT family transport system ATP-binding protein
VAAHPLASSVGTGVDPSPAVEIHGLNKAFAAHRGAADLVALSGIDLVIAPGQFVSLIGPSGCGKSTLLRVIGDLLPPTSGTVLVNGRPAPEARRQRQYGMVFQAPVLFDWRSVERNVELSLESQVRSKPTRRERVQAMLRLVDLGDFGRHQPWQLSGGMQQRVAIARALAPGPSILLMDEPFGALDEMTRERLNLELLQIWEATRTTIVFVTHSIPEAVFLSTEVIVMSPRPGRIVDRVPIDLPHPRTVDTRETSRYFELVTRVRESLRGEEAGSVLAEPIVQDGYERIAAEGLM